MQLVDAGLNHSALSRPRARGLELQQLRLQQHSLLQLAQAQAHRRRGLHHLHCIPLCSAAAGRHVMQLSYQRLFRHPQA